MSGSWETVHAHMREFNCHDRLPSPSLSLIHLRVERTYPVWNEKRTDGFFSPIEDEFPTNLFNKCRIRMRAKRREKISHCFRLVHVPIHCPLAARWSRNVDEKNNLSIFDCFFEGSASSMDDYLLTINMIMTDIRRHYFIDRRQKQCLTHRM